MAPNKPRSDAYGDVVCNAADHVGIPRETIDRFLATLQMCGWHLAPVSTSAPQPANAAKPIAWYRSGSHGSRFQWGSEKPSGASFDDSRAPDAGGWAPLYSAPQSETPRVDTAKDLALALDLECNKVPGSLDLKAAEQHILAALRSNGGSAKAPEFVPVDFKPWLQSLPPEDTKAIFRRVWDLYDGGAAAPSEGEQR